MEESSSREKPGAGLLGSGSALSPSGKGGAVATRGPMMMQCSTVPAKWKKAHDNDHDRSTGEGI